jgi:hypothetical protein
MTVGSPARRAARSPLERLRARIDSYPVGLSSALLFVLLVPLYVATATMDGMQSSDPLSAAIPAWQYAVHGSFNLDAFADLPLWWVDGPDHLVSNRAPGVIFFAIPFYWLLPTNPVSPNVAPAMIAAVIATAGAVTILHVLFRRFVRPSTALAAALLAALGTSTWSVSADALWPPRRKNSRSVRPDVML